MGLFPRSSTPSVFFGRVLLQEVRMGPEIHRPRRESKKLQCLKKDTRQYMAQESCLLVLLSRFISPTNPGGPVNTSAEDVVEHVPPLRRLFFHHHGAEHTVQGLGKVLLSIQMAGLRRHHGSAVEPGHETKQTTHVRQIKKDCWRRPLGLDWVPASQLDTMLV